LETAIGGEFFGGSEGALTNIKDPEESMVTFNLQPGCNWSASLIFLGMVTCPLLVKVDCMMTHFLMSIGRGTLGFPFTTVNVMTANEIKRNATSFCNWQQKLASPQQKQGNAQVQCIPKHAIDECRVIRTG
jgi:hypothetical protein